MEHRTDEHPKSPLDYGRTGRINRPRLIRVLKWFLLVCLPIGLYVGLYLGFSSRQAFNGGLYYIGYPGAGRWYALSNRAAASLARDDDPGNDTVTVRRFHDSVWREHSHAWFWRAFYPLERLEIYYRGGRLVSIDYAGAPIDAPTATAARAAATNPAAPQPKLPFVGAVYHEAVVRDGRLFRFVGAVYGGRAAFFLPVERTDVYLFEWDLAAPFAPDAPPRTARVRQIDSQTNARWARHWLIDADHYLTWDGFHRRASLLQFTGEGRPATVVGTIEGVRPLRCDGLGSIAVSRSARLFAAEKDALCVFSTRTLAPVRKLKETPALQQFFAARTDELDAKFSRCYLTDDGKQLVRIIAFYELPEETTASPRPPTAVIYDLDSDTTRDLPFNRSGSEVTDVERVGGALQFCIRFLGRDNKWRQQLVDESLHPLADIAPAYVSGSSESVTWDAASATVVDLPGGRANLPARSLDSEITVGDTRTGRGFLGVIRHADPAGRPPLFQPGLTKLPF